MSLAAYASPSRIARGSVSETVTKAIAAGAIGFNLEDQIIGEEALFSISDQSARIPAARGAADQTAIPAFIDARADLFLKADSARHDGRLLNAALGRAEAYTEAGASGLFAPGLVNEPLIGELCKACPLPVNILVIPTTPPAKRLAELSVSRVSYGPGPYRLAMRALEDAARAAFSSIPK